MADGVIESIGIEIGASSNEAVTKIEGITKALKELKTACRGTIPSKLIDGIKELGGAANSLSSEKIGKLFGLGNALKSFSEVGKLSIPSSFSNNLFDLAAAVSSINSEQIQNLNQLGDALKNGLGNVDTAFSENIRDVGNALQYFSNIKTSSINKNLPSMLAELGSVIRQFSEEDLAVLTEVSGALARLGGGSIGISKATPETLQSLMSVVASLSEEDIAKLDQLTTALERLKGVNLKGLGGAAGALKNLGSGENTKGLKDSADALNKTAMRATKLYKVVNSFGRIAFYRLIRSAIRAITESFAEGTKNAYAFSKAFESHRDGTLTIAEAYDQMASASFKMSNQLGAAWASLVRAIQPLIMQILSWITQLANALTQFFALLGGKSTYLKAIDYNKQWGDSASGAAAAAKEWKNQLLGFDEINRLEEPSDGGGGGGGGVGDVGNMFEETEVSEKILNIFEKIKSAIAWCKDHLDLIKNLAIAIGLALLTWKIAEIVDWFRNLSTFMTKALGIAMSIAGAFLLITGAIDAIKNGVDWDNVLEMIGGAILLAGGLALVFGHVGAAIGLIISAFVMLGVAIYDWIKTGELSIQSFTLIEAAILSLGVALTLLTGSWIPIAVAAVVAALAAIVYAIVSNWETISDFFGRIRDAIVNAFQNAFGDALDAAAQFFEGISQIFSGLVNFLVSVFAGQWRNAWQNVVQIFHGIKNTIAGIVNNIISLINSLLAPLRNIGSAIKSFGASAGFNIHLGEYATGGFPEDGLFMANHGELVGQFANGKTAVANNEEITAGIARATYDAFMAAFADSSGGNGSNKKTEFVFQLNGKEFARAIYSDQNAVSKEYGVSYLANG